MASARRRRSGASAARAASSREEVVSRDEHGCPPRRSRSGGSSMFTTREAVVEVLAEPRRPAPRASRSRLVAAMMRTSTWSGCVPPTRSNSALLQDAQELDLEGERHLADLVEEERAAVRAARSLPLVARVRAGEGAALVAEELALEQGLGDRAAVDRHERPVGSRAVRVDRARDELLARCRSRPGSAR